MGKTKAQWQSDQDDASNKIDRQTRIMLVLAARLPLEQDEKYH
jgi:hypothetical protein